MSMSILALGFFTGHPWVFSGRTRTPVQPVSVTGGFSRATARAHSTLRCTASPHGPPRVALLNFWTPADLVLAPCASYSLQFCLDSLCTSPSPFPPDSLDYSARAHSLSARSARCQFLPEYLLQIHELSFTIFPTLLTVFYCHSYLVSILYPVVSNVTSPKAHFPSPTSSPLFLFSPQSPPSIQTLHLL